uniref:EIF3F/CSN6-like C-terminal domain-containing protein n=1 Tax=Spongospora subterranea TaxID=70186 RepID=A0A0H5QJ72_9EUKA|eukprot:CRZ01702.1 hypothetical protein [Spongospora subterranea]
MKASKAALGFVGYLGFVLVLSMIHFIFYEDKAVYSTHEVLGWYMFTEKYEVPDVARVVQTQMERYNESPLFLHFITEAQIAYLPAVLYVAVSHDKKRLFSPIPYTIATEEAERLTVDYLSNQSVVGGSNALSMHLRSLSKSIAIMCERLQILISYLSDHPELHNGQLLRDIKTVCNSLPIVQDCPAFDKKFCSELVDSLLLTKCAATTRASECIQKLLEKCWIAFPDNIEHRKRRVFM